MIQKQPASGSETGGTVPGEVQRDATREASDARKDGYRSTLALGILLSVAIHAAAVQLAPAFHVAGVDVASSGLEALELPPEVNVPPPPEQIARPATPTVAEARVSEEVTIAPTTFEANPAERLPPPPKAKTPGASERPAFIPRDVDPRLKNGPEIQKLLEELYPPELKSARIGGTVVLWLFVDAQGTVEKTLVQRSSGYLAFDEAAASVARNMAFVPAINRDRPIGVWIAQPINFEVK